MPGMDMADDAVAVHVLLDRVEQFHSSDGNGQAVDAQAWVGGDLDKLWLKVDGERSNGRLGATRTEALWNRAIAPYWGLQAGVRHDFGDGPGRTWAAFGVQGLAPYWFDVQATGLRRPERADRAALRGRIRPPADAAADPAARRQGQPLRQERSASARSARGCPTSMPACGCATRSRASSHPTSAWSGTASSATPPLRARRRQRRSARRASSPAFASGSEGCAMRPVTKHVLATLAVLVVGAAAAFAWFVASGAYNFAADEPHTPIVRALLETMRERSIETRAGGLQVPDLAETTRDRPGRRQLRRDVRRLPPGARDERKRAQQGPLSGAARIYRRKGSTRLTRSGSSSTASRPRACRPGARAWSDEYMWNMAAFLQELPRLDADALQGDGRAQRRSPSRPWQRP